MTSVRCSKLNYGTKLNMETDVPFRPMKCENDVPFMYTLSSILKRYDLLQALRVNLGTVAPLSSILAGTNNVPLIDPLSRVVNIIDYFGTLYLELLRLMDQSRTLYGRDW